MAAKKKVICLIFKLVLEKTAQGTTQNPEFLLPT